MDEEETSDEELRSRALKMCAAYFDSGKIGGYAAVTVAEELGVDLAEAVRILRNLDRRGLVDFTRAGDVSQSIVTRVTPAGLDLADRS